MKYLKRFENKDVKITVEQVDSTHPDNSKSTKADNFHFIGTYWDKNNCLEPDREVLAAETYGGAVSIAFDYLAKYLAEKKNLERNLK